MPFVVPEVEGPGPKVSVLLGPNLHGSGVSRLEWWGNIEDKGKIKDRTCRDGWDVISGESIFFPI